MLKEKLIEYIDDLFGVSLTLEEYTNVNELPVFLTQKYDFYLARMFENKFLIMYVKDDNELHLGAIKKHVKKLGVINHDVVMVMDKLNNYRRQSLIKNRMPFIVPGLQIYLPFIGIAYKEYLENKYKKDVIYDESLRKKKFTPAEQALYLDLIVNGTKGRSQLEIAKSIGISKIAVSRAFNILEDIGIVKSNKIGAKKIYSFTMLGKALLNEVERYLINPVERKVFVDINSFDGNIKELLVEAGETALANITMLAHPRTDVYAMYKKDWIRIKDQLEEVPSDAENRICIQLWTHPIPKINNEINPLALYLSFRDENDERILSVIDSLVDKIKWSSIKSTSEGIVASNEIY